MLTLVPASGATLGSIVKQILMIARVTPAAMADPALISLMISSVSVHCHSPETTAIPNWIPAIRTSVSEIPSARLLPTFLILRAPAALDIPDDFAMKMLTSVFYPHHAETVQPASTLKAHIDVLVPKAMKERTVSLTLMIAHHVSFSIENDFENIYNFSFFFQLLVKMVAHAWTILATTPVSASTALKGNTAK